jgi:hypothetical protein
VLEAAEAAERCCFSTINSARQIDKRHEDYTMPTAKALIPVTHDKMGALIECTLDRVRDDLIENPYIIEALRVLPVRGYRSAIGNVWNAVVDDLRNKVIDRSLPLFNKAIQLKREVKRYEDFQNLVTDDDLIDGAREIGVIGWEASKVLKHAKETRHIFDGHPRSSEPSAIKVLAMLDDCVRYVLAEPYPPEVVDIDEYVATMQSADFDRSEFAITNAITDLPEVYKKELIHRLFNAYIHEDAPTDLRSNIELVAPILWKSLDKHLKVQVVRRVDKQIAKGNAARTKEAFHFVRVVKASVYLSPTAKSYLLKPLVAKLANSLDQWADENDAVEALAPYASVIPADLIPAYVSAITLTYIGYMGRSYQWSRRDFYADIAALRIPKMMEKFDDKAAAEFVKVIRTNKKLRERIQDTTKLARLRTLAKIVLGRVSAAFPERKLLKTLVNPERESQFRKLLSSRRSVTAARR